MGGGRGGKYRGGRRTGTTHFTLICLRRDEERGGEERKGGKKREGKKKGEEKRRGGRGEELCKVK